MTNATEVPKSTLANAILVGAAWVAVGVPLLWGVTQSLFKAAALFR